jgi:hypothetical protein
MNRRYSLQQSLFVSTGISEIPLMKQLQFLCEKIEKSVVKIEIPACYKNDALRDLHRMNLIVQVSSLTLTDMRFPCGFDSIV